MQMAKAYAAMDGRDYLLPDDVKTAAVPVLRHRLVLKPEADMEGLTSDQVIADVLGGNRPERDVVSEAAKMRDEMASHKPPKGELDAKLLPGEQRLNLHAFYAETGSKAVDRDALAPEHFARWMDWAKGRGIGLDFNPTYFAHPMAASGFTLSHADPAVRKFWIAHGQASRRVAEAFSRKLGSAVVNNHWIPDGTKDAPADRFGPRYILAVGNAALVIAMVWLTLTGSVAMAIGYGILRAITAGTWVLASEVAWPALFGNRHLGSIVGASYAFAFVGAAIG